LSPRSPEVVITDEVIDETILSRLMDAEGRWRKVAFVIVHVMRALQDELPDDDESYERIARRIESLAKEGRLIAQGDVKNWRLSEIRLARPN